MLIYEQILKRVTDKLSKARTDACLGKAAEQAAEAADMLIGRERDKTSFEFIACRVGCAHCCVVYITVLLPEAVNIARYLREQGEAERLIPLLVERVRETMWTEEQDWSLLGKKCIFLDKSGGCSVYPVRPLLCRAVTSVSAEDCHEALTARIMGEEKPILMNLAVKKNYEQAFRAMAGAMEKCGMDSAGLELTRAVLCALRHDDIAERLGKGEKIRPC
ncbi:YkgJ family cysteine cluster protein [Geovibrio thiophilus]|uniref:YkgJ family cysteine cluster protein n=1 Tax=Geovibrio thiophilus TaxID=139438 RepID=A0A3R5X2K0_9BACT|nr:YkgJ family cysteine cluster protein [Geovibrio thiophilus]QAR32989.1 YkgJ family cysteine cluster protein [Geovibrio thiophilus]